MTLTNLLFHIASSIYQHAVLLILCIYFLRPEKRKLTTPVAIIAYIVSFFCILAIQLTNNNWILLSLFLFLIIYMFALKAITGSNIITNAVTVCFSYLIIILTDLPCIFISMAVFPPAVLLNEGSVSFYVAIGGSIFTFLFVKFIPLENVYQWLTNIPSMLGYFILLLLTFLSVLCDLDNELTSVSPALLPILTICFAFSSSLLLIYQILSNRQNVQSLRYYELYLPSLDNLIQKVCDVQHGHNNMLQAIVHLSELDMDPEALRLQLAGYAQHIQKAVLPSSFLQLNNRLLSALLYYKYCQADERSISMEFNIVNPLCQSHANEFELVESVGILIDNAIESCQENDTIYITININKEKKKNRFYIKVENPGPIADDAFLHNIFSKGYTTKKSDSESHGIGLGILRNIVKKHRGKLIVSNTEGADHVRYIVFELVL